MRKSADIKSVILGNSRLIALIIILAGALVRFVALGTNPVGLNQDEASAGYEAFALLTSGIDRNGTGLPVLFISWGSGQNVLYSYLTIPFIALFGLNAVSVRLVAALFGTLTLPLFYLLARRLRGESFGLTALFTLALNPWHIMISRWALESNLLPLFLLLGIYFVVLGSEKPVFLLAAAPAFALSLYAYGTAYIFLPCFLILSLIVLIRRGALRPQTFLPACLLFIVIALPVTLCNVINVLGLNEMKIFGFTLPVLTETSQTATTVIGEGTISAALANFRDFLKLLWTQSDSLLYNSIPGFGLFYVFGLPTALLGLISAVCNLFRGRRGGETFMLLALLCGFLAAFVIKININRMNMAFLPLVYFSALGVYELVRWLRVWGILPLAGMTVCFAVFVVTYFTAFRTNLSTWFFEGLGEAIEYSESLDKNEVYVTSSVNAPYIYVLFYNEIPPEEFVGGVRYINPDGAFRAVSSFGKYRFSGAASGADTAFVLTKKEAEGKRILAVFGNYVVAEE